MGLDCSHNAFNGSYNSFNRLRQKVCFAMGGSFPPHWQYDNNGKPILDEYGLMLKNNNFDDEFLYLGKDYNVKSHPGLTEFLSHSDCDGSISPEMCSRVADELEALIPRVKEIDDMPEDHVVMRWETVGVLQKFINGCRSAAAADEYLEFS